MIMDVTQRPTPRTIPTGTELDQVTGIGGVPRGALTDITGNDESSQADLLCSLVAQAQARGLLCVVVDGGRGMDLSAAQRRGVDLPHTLVCQPPSAEEALSIALTIVRTQQVGLLVLDSLSLLPTQGEHMGEYERDRYEAHLVGRSLRELHTEASRTGCAVVFVARSIDRGAQLGAPLGSNAIRFYSALRVEMSEGLAPVVRKNKFAPSLLRTQEEQAA